MRNPYNPTWKGDQACLQGENVDELWSRRQFLRRSISTAVLAQAGALFGQPTGSSQTGKRMEAWSAGFLDIHHISTGRGNSVLSIFPDGTSLMIDAGAVGGPT